MNKDDNLKSWKYSVNFDPYAKAVELTSGAESIKESLYILFSTAPGEREMEPDYGCDLRALAFQRLNLSLETQVVNDIKRAVAAFEPRIELTDVKLSHADEMLGCINISLEYVIKATEERDTMTYAYTYQS